MKSNYVNIKRCSFGKYLIYLVLQFMCIFFTSVWTYVLCSQECCDIRRWQIDQVGGDHGRMGSLRSLHHHSCFKLPPQSLELSKWPVTTCAVGMCACMWGRIQSVPLGSCFVILKMSFLWFIAHYVWIIYTNVPLFVGSWWWGVCFGSTPLWLTNLVISWSWW